MRAGDTAQRGSSGSFLLYSGDQNKQINVAMMVILVKLADLTQPKSFLDNIFMLCAGPSAINIFNKYVLIIL